MERMHSRSFANADTLNGIAHGFMEVDRNGYRIIGHDGSVFYFMSQLYLIPETGTGLFISFNSDSGGYAGYQVCREFADYFFPTQDSIVPIKKDSITEEPGLAGYYAGNRRSHSNFTKFGRIMSSFEVVQPEPGVIIINGYDSSRWQKIAPLQYKNANSEDQLIFRKNEQGEVSHLFFNGMPAVGFDKLTFIEQPKSLIYIFILFLIPIFIRIAAPHVISFLNRRKKDSPAQKLAPLPSYARLLSLITGVLLLAFLGFQWPLLTDQKLVFFELSATVQYSFILPIVACITTALHVIGSVLGWTKQQGHPVNRLTHSLLSLAFVTLLLDLYYWNILGFNF